MIRTTVAAMTLVLVAAPAAPAPCGDDITQTADRTDGVWTSADGPLVRVQPDGSWEAVTGSTVDTVGVRTGIVESGEAAVSAAVLVQGGESGRLPDLADARTATFHGTTSCDAVVDVAWTAGHIVATEDVIGDADAVTTTTTTVAPVWTPPLYPTWRGRVR